MITFRNADRRWPFLWDSPAQPAARWHAAGEGPVQYLSDTPDGAWAEFLRHEEIGDPADLPGISRALWAVQVDDAGSAPAARPRLPRTVMTGGLDTYPACQAAARRLRGRGHTALTAPSAALQPGCAAGWQVRGRLRPGPPRDATMVVLFGARPDLVGWRVVDDGRPPAAILDHVRHL